MKLDLEIREQVVKLAGDIEKRFKVNCLVVSNKYRIPFSLGQVPISLNLLPLEGDSEEAFKVKVEAVAAEYNDFMRFPRKWHCYLVCLYNTRPWFSRFADKKERFPLMDMAAGADLISPVIYGKKYLAKLHKEAEDFFGEGIIDFWKKEAQRRQKEKQKKLKALYKEEFLYRKERKKLLNKHELGELKDFVSFALEKCKKEKISLVVALDGSGRPIGKALEWSGVACPVVCLDPHQMRAVNFQKSDETRQVLEILKKEFPQIHAALSEDPQSVFFVDDQTGYGGTGERLKSLVKLFAKNGDTPLNYAVMTPYMGNNTPSWLRRREIQGLVMAPEGSLSAIDAPTPQSKRFYGRLKKIVAGWQ